MRVCLVSSELAPVAGGGAGMYAQQMAGALARAGVETHLLTFPHPGLAEHAPVGVRVHTIAMDRGLAAVKAYHGRPMRHAMAVHEALEPLHAEHTFDVIEFPDFGAEGWFCFRARRTRGAYPGAVLALRAHMPIFLCDRLNQCVRRGRRSATMEFMERECFELADVVISPSAALRDELARRSVRMQRCEVVPNPMQLPPPHSTTTQRGPTIVVPGRLEWRKGTDVAVRAAIELLDAGRRFTLVLAGRDTKTGPLDTSMRAYLESLLDSRDDARISESIRFAGSLGRGELDALLARSAGAVFASRWENLPYAVAEAMAAGTPVVVSDTGGMRELVGNAGRVVPSEDIEQLASSMAAMLDACADDAGKGRDRVAALMAPPAIVRASLDAWQRATPRIVPLATSARVSAVVPLFELGEFLPETLDALAKQTRPLDEVLVVDDASRDEPTVKLLAKLERTGWPGLRVRVRRLEHNAGPAAARNAGVRACDAELVFAVDADDVPDRAIVERLCEALERNPESAFATGMHARFHGTPGTLESGWTPIGLDAAQLLAWNTGGGGCGLVLRRSALDAVGGWDETVPGYEDWDLCCRLALASYPAELVPEFLLWRRLRDDGVFQRQDKPRHAMLRAELIRRHGELASTEHEPGDTARLLLAEMASAAERKPRSEQAKRGARRSADR